MNFEEAVKETEVVAAVAAPIQTTMADKPMYAIDGLRPLDDICELRCDGVEGTHCASTTNMQRDVTDVPVEELRPFFGLCCNICGLFCGFPSCIGMSGSTTCLCEQNKFVCCKLLDCKDEDSRCCACLQCNQYLTAPNKCYECTGQYCCLELRGAFPCTNKVPCVFGLCGVMCCADYKWIGCQFMPRLGDVIPRLDERQGKGQS